MTNQKEFNGISDELALMLIVGARFIVEKLGTKNPDIIM